MNPIENNQAIIDALQKSGYLFEHEVATKLEVMGFHVETNKAFQDADSNKSREIDVVATTTYAIGKNIIITLELLIECKASDSPMVFIERDKNKRDKSIHGVKEYPILNKKLLFPTGPQSLKETSLFSHFKVSQSHYYLKSDKKHTQFAKISNKGGQATANHDGIYDSLLLPLAKLLENRISETKNKTFNDIDIFHLFFPVVVLKSGLKSCSIQNGNPALSDETRITFIRNIESEGFKGHYMTDFITFDNIENYINKDVLPFVNFVNSIIKDNPSWVWSNKNGK